MALSPKAVKTITDTISKAAKKASEKVAKREAEELGEEAAKKAAKAKEQAKAWREEKKSLESQYGELRKVPADKPRTQKMRNTPEAVQKRVEKAREFLSQPTEPWTPPPAELQAFDRSLIKDALEGFPDVEQSRFPRDIPARTDIGYVEDLYTDPVNRELIIQQIERGLPLGGETFYASLYPVKRAVQEAGGTAEDFNKWIHSIAPASARNSILNEMAVGQFLRDLNAKGIPLTEENVTKAMQAFKEQNKIGLPLMPIHREGVEKVLGGIDLREQNLANIPTNYKIPTYGTQKAGDFGKSVVLDTHESAGQTLGSELHPYFSEQGGFKGGEYGAGEAGMLSIAEEMGIPGGMAQAGRWFGGGELTGLRSPRGDALDLLEKQVAYTLLQRGIQPNPANIREEVLRQIMTGEGTLLPYFKSEPLPDVRMKGLQRAEGGEVDLEAEFRKADMIAPQHFGEGGEADKPALKGETAKPSLKEELDNYIQQENLNTLLQELAKRIQLSGEMAQSREGKQAFGRLGYRQPIGDDMSVGVGARGHYFKGDGFKDAGVDRADMSLSKRFKDESELRARLGANLNEQMGKRGLDELMLEYEIPFKDGGNVQHFGLGGLAKGAKKIAETAKKATAKALERQKTEYELAHELAQKRAALPVEEGGLGLPPDNTAMDRARALGFDVDNIEYHTTDVKKIPSIYEHGFVNMDTGERNFKHLGKEYGGDRYYATGQGNYTSSSPFASWFTAQGKLGADQAMLPLVINKSKHFDFKNPTHIQDLMTPRESYQEILGKAEMNPKDLKALQEGKHYLMEDWITLMNLKKRGYTGTNLIEPQQYYAGEGVTTNTFKPSNIRSVNAAFDPFRRNEADILAGLMALPAIELLGDDKKPSKSDKKKVKGYKNGGDLEEEFRKADMIDMSGFRQDPLEKATRRADNRPKKRNVMSELNQPIKPFFDPTGKLRMYSDVIKDVGSDLAGQVKERFNEDIRDPDLRAISDVALNVGADWLGSAADLVSMLPEKFKSTPIGLDEYLMSKLSKKSGKKSSNNLDEMFTSETLRKKLKEYGLVERDRPTIELPLAFGTPVAAKALAKGAKAIAPDVMRAIEKATVDPYKFNIVKPEGGQFIDSTLKENLKQLKQGEEGNQINKALDAWVDSTLRKYVVNRMGTESDEVRKLFDKGITHVSPEQLKGAPSARTLEQHRARLPGSGKRAETEVGQAWEDASDYSLYGRRRSSYDDRDVEKYPWLSKMAPEDMVYGASIDSSALKDRLGFGHVIDVIRGDLRSGKLRPEQLNKVSVEDAIKRTHAFNQEMAKKAEETAITVQNGMPVHREYPEGYKWVELKHPDAKKTEEMLAYEGDTMGHCVGKDGNYCEDVMSGQARIFSLRDAKGEPHVTIEVQPEKGVVYSQMADLLGEKEVDRLLESGISPREIVDAHPELQELRTFRINQIKGKGNAKPLSKYIPFVQDFVKNPVSGKEWADVREFHNTDLLDAKRIREHGVVDSDIYKEIEPELERIYPQQYSPSGLGLLESEHGRLITPDIMLKNQMQDLTSPYLTKEDIINHLRSKEALPVEQSYSKYYENLPKDEGMAHGGDVHMAKGGLMGAVEAASKLGQESMRRFAGKLNKLSRNVAYNTYEQVPYVGAKHLEGMTERPFGEKLFFTEEAPWGSPEKDADLLAKYLGLESGPSQKGVGLYQPPIKGAPLEFNPQISSRTLVKSDKGRRKENLIAEPDKASMTALGATRGYLDVQGASPWVRPSQGSGRLYNGFHISLDGKPTEEEMRKIGEIQARYGFWGAGDLGKSGVYVGFNPEMTRDDLNKMQRAFRKDIKEALGDRVAGVKMMKSEGDYPAFEEAWKAPQGTGTVTRQLMEYLDTAKEKNPLLAEYYAQKPSTELQKLMQEMNIRDIKAPEKYGVGAPREDVMKARDIFSEYGIEGLRDALNRGEYLPAAVAIPSGIELFRDDN